MHKDAHGGRPSCLTIVLLCFALSSVVSCGPGFSSKAQNFARLPDDPGTEPHSIAKPVDESFVKDTVIPGVALVSGKNGFLYPSDLQSPDAEKILDQFKSIDPHHIVPAKLLKKAVLFYKANSSQVTNRKYIGVIDFSRRSTEQRFFIINMSNGEVWPVHVAHGKGSDLHGEGYAERFSNVEGTNASSLGFYVTAETYDGDHGLSLRLDGVSATNSNVRERDIVLHGADYVTDEPVIQGRSWGCPAVPMEDRDEVVERVKEGAVIYAGLSAKE